MEGASKCFFLYLATFTQLVLIPQKDSLSHLSQTFGGGGGLYISWSTVPLSRAVVIMLRGKISQVWMDDYKRLFYMHRPDLVNIQIGKE